LIDSILYDPELTFFAAMNWRIAKGFTFDVACPYGSGAAAAFGVEADIET
jgi:hypothetical protein